MPSLPHDTLAWRSSWPCRAYAGRCVGVDVGQPFRLDLGCFGVALGECRTRPRAERGRRGRTVSGASPTVTSESRNDLASPRIVRSRWTSSADRSAEQHYADRCRTFVPRARDSATSEA